MRNKRKWTIDIAITEPDFPIGRVQYSGFVTDTDDAFAVALRAAESNLNAVTFEVMSFRASDSTRWRWSGKGE